MASGRPLTYKPHAHSMAPRKRRRAHTPPTLSSPDWTLPVDLVLEIVARSDAATLVRCAAACKLLRREILRPAFLGRVCQEPDGVVPPRLLGYLADDRTDVFCLMHPATPAAASFAENQLAPFVWRCATRLLEEYKTVASRGGLVLLQRRSLDEYDVHCTRRLRSHRLSDLCVYDPMSGECAFLPFPPDIDVEQWHHSYALLTAADGIGCAFLLLAANMAELISLESCFSVQAVSSGDAGEWGPVARVENALRPWRWSVFTDRVDAVVVIDGVASWMVGVGHYIITYDVRTAAAGWIELPAVSTADDDGDKRCRMHLGSSPDGRLCLFAVDELRVSLWVLSSGEWERYAELDLLPHVRSLFELYTDGADLFEAFQFQLTELGLRSRTLLIWLEHCPDSPLPGNRLGRFVVDMDKSEIGWTGMTMRGVPYEVDLLSQLSAMKTY